MSANTFRVSFGRKEKLFIKMEKVDPPFRTRSNTILYNVSMMSPKAEEWWLVSSSRAPKKLCYKKAFRYIVKNELGGDRYLKIENETNPPHSRMRSIPPIEIISQLPYSSQPHSPVFSHVTTLVSPPLPKQK